MMREGGCSKWQLESQVADAKNRKVAKVSVPQSSKQSRQSDRRSGGEARLGEVGGGGGVDVGGARRVEQAARETGSEKCGEGRR